MFRRFSYEFGYEFRFFKGGSGGGGGGGSGAVSYPAYMQTIHNDWLDNTGVDTITSSMTDIMDAAQGNSPWTGQTAYDPDADVALMVASHGVFQALVTLLSTGTTLDTVVTNILSDTYVDDAVDEYEADANARVTATILPRFQRGMQDINAVVSSAFVIGQANIEAEVARNVNRFSVELHLKAASDDALRIVQLKLEYQRLATATLIEMYRIKIVAKKEENETEMRIDESDALWDLEIFQYGANLLGAIGGGVVNPQGKQPSTAQSMIGGAMSGAAAGAMIAGASQGAIAGPVGMIGGAVLGAASALL